MTTLPIARRLSTIAAVSALLAFEAGTGWLLHRLGRLDGFSVDWSDPIRWATTADLTELLGATGRLAGLALAAWLLASTLASLARRAVPACRQLHALDALSLPVVRRTLDRLLAVSLGASTLLGPATAASAASPTTTGPAARPPAALVVIGDDGDPTVLPAGAREADPAKAVTVRPPEGLVATDSVAPRTAAGPAVLVEGETLVVRDAPPAPAEAATASTTTAPTTTTTTPEPTTRPAAPSTTSPVTTPRPSPAPTPGSPTVTAPAERRTAPVVAPATPARPTAPEHYTIQPGDSLWLVAERWLSRPGAAAPGDGEVARYWVRLVEANRATLRSGNPGLVFPGEIVVLPPH